MKLRLIAKRARAYWPTLKRIGPRCFLLLATGCRSVATPYCCDPGETSCSRSNVLTRQVMVDSAVEVGQRPLATSWWFLRETAEHVTALTRGEICKRVMLPCCGTPEPLSQGGDKLGTAQLEADLERLSEQDALEPASVRLQMTGAESLEALDQLIGRAQHRIDVIMFQWESDELGQKIADRLAAVAGPNLRVRILIDGGGNLFFSEPEVADAAKVNRVIHDLAQHPNVEVVRIRNPFAHYDHRKLVIVDGRWVWTGGRNFSSCAFFQHHDLTLVMDGPLVAQIQKRFDGCWEDQGGLSPEDRGAESTVVQQAILSAPANCQARLLDSEPGNRQLADAIYDAVDRARHHIYVENVYLTDSRLIVKLAEARRRGVDVRVVTTVQSTTPTINQANRAVVNRLLAAGVHVYLYPGMTHVKAIAVDGVWAYLGTGNLDALSLRHNQELGLSISSATLVLDLEERLFQQDMQPAWELTEPLPLTFENWLCEWVASVCL